MIVYLIKKKENCIDKWHQEIICNADKRPILVYSINKNDARWYEEEDAFKLIHLLERKTNILHEMCPFKIPDELFEKST